MRFTVWSPNAKQMTLHLRLRTVRMEGNGSGWWLVDVPEGHGTDYAFSIDGGPPLPDPRSPWQPDGVHGWSRAVDHSVFNWTDNLWQSRPLSSAVIYELHIGTFTPEGTYSAVASKFDYLRDLGVTHIELLPVNQFSGTRGWGYDGVAFYAPQNTYGTPEDLKRLVNTAHEKGLGVILDVVYNHFGHDGAYVSMFGPYLTDRYTTPWGDAINYDGRLSDEVRRFVLDNVQMWLRDYHFDGLRIDAVQSVHDASAIHILEQMAEEVHDLQSRTGKYLFLVAESDLNNPRIVWPRNVGGYGLDAQWCDDFHHALHSILTGDRHGYYRDFGSLAHLAKAYKKAFVYDGIHSLNRERRHGRDTVGLSGHKFLAYMQSHDQIANLARIGHVTSLDQVKIGAALVFCSPFVVMLFQGEEWATSAGFNYFCEYEDEQLTQSIWEGRKKECMEYGWDPEDVPPPHEEKTFRESVLDWSELAREPHKEMREWYKSLIALRRKYTDIASGHLDKVHVAYSEQDRWFSLDRGQISVICNLASQPQKIALEPWHISNVLLASKEPIGIHSDWIELQEHSVAILGPTVADMKFWPGTI